MGRSGHGVRAIRAAGRRLCSRGSGNCAGRHLADRDEEGKGRRSWWTIYRTTKRGGLGIRNYAKGGVAAVKIVDDTDDLILISATAS